MKKNIKIKLFIMKLNMKKYIKSIIVIFLFIFLIAGYVIYCNVNKFEFTVENGEATLVNCNTNTIGKVVVPKEYEGYPVTKIGYTAFKGCFSVSKIQIPDSIREIDEGAFVYCISLEEVNIPKSVTRIGNCTFSNCKKLKKVDLEGNIVYIGALAFEFCTNLEEIKLPDSVESMDSEAFCECWKLKKINLPSGLKEIPNACFRSCISLEQIDLPLGIEKIGTAAFWNCRNLKKIEFPDSLKSIDRLAFESCATLREVKLCKNIEILGDDVFSCNMNLERIDVDEDNANYKSIDGVLYSKDGNILIQYPGGKKDKIFTVPNEVKRMETYSFSCCYNLEKLIVPNKETEVAYDIMYFLPDVKKEYHVEVQAYREAVSKFRIIAEEYNVDFVYFED